MDERELHPTDAPAGFPTTKISLGESLPDYDSYPTKKELVEAYQELCNYMNSRGERLFGRVVMFCTTNTWEAMAVIYPIRVKKLNGLLVQDGDLLLAKRCILVREIQGVFGRIQREIQGGKKTFLVGVI